MKIGIVGGGAAGMMAACIIAESKKNHEVFLIERNSNIGKKVLISGGGRCNVTTGYTSIKEILKKYPRGGNFLKYAMHEFFPEKVMQFFENHGVGLKISKDMRVFPVSDNGMDVVKMFENLFTKYGVNLLTSRIVKGISKEREKFSIFFEDGETLKVDKLILTTGGQAYRSTGSTGDGYSFAENLGHTVTKLAPSLNAFNLEEGWVGNLSGVSFQKASLKIIGEKTHEFAGPFLFTHKGISGPAVFALSALSAYEECPMKLFIDFFPEENYEKLNIRLSEKIKNNDKKLFVNILKDFIPQSVAHSFLELLKIDESKKVSETSKKDMNQTIELLKNLKLTIVSRQTGEEFVTAGGVDLDEVNPKTMESKICPGLYFAGELLDIDGFTGGFNLQAAWCTGKIAGESSAN